MWGLKKRNLMKWIMDKEFIQYMKETAEELRELRIQVMRLQNMVLDKSVKSRFMEMNEACNYLHISRATMQKRIEKGEITFASKQGGKYLFPEEKLKAYASGLY